MIKLKSLKGNFSHSNKLIKKLLSIILIIAIQAISISGFMQIEVIAAQSTADTNANTKTKNILDNLSVLKDKSDAKVVSGQEVCDGNGMYELDLPDVWYSVSEAYDKQITDLHTTTGEWVGLQGYDLWRHDESIIDGKLVNPLTDPVQAIDSSNWRDYAKSHSDNGGLVTMICHFRNPWGRDSFGRGKSWSDIPTGNNLGDLIDPTKPVYNTWISMMDKVASELQWFEDNNVTVLWRPLPESNGDWFWWCQGSDTDFKNVWQHMFNYLTNTKGLHNLIWVYNPSENGFIPPAINRYPGSNYVDIIGIDCYRESLGRLNLYNKFINYGKVLALSEVGGPTNMASIISDIKTYNPNIAYYMAWYGSYSIQSNNNQSGLLGDSWSVNRGDIDFSVPAPTTAPTETPTETPTVAPTVTVTPTPTQVPTIEPTPLAFTDLEGYEWAVEFINTLSSRGVIIGNGDGTFNPGNNITRGEFAKMLTVAFGIYDSAAVSAFTDVPSGSWYNSYIASLEKEGLTVGKGDGTFSPDLNMTREEMFAFNARAMAKYNGETILANDSEETGIILAGFVDGVSVSDWARGYVATNVKLQIDQGSDVEGGKAMKPQNPIIRAEVAVVLAKTMD